MYRTNNCGELKISDVGKTVTLAGWVQKIRNKGFLIWIEIIEGTNILYGFLILVFDYRRFIII